MQAHLAGCAADGLELGHVRVQVLLEHLPQGRSGVRRQVVAVNLGHLDPVPGADARVAQGGNERNVLLHVRTETLAEQGLSSVWGGFSSGVARKSGKIIKGQNQPSTRKSIETESNKKVILTMLRILKENFL